MELNGISPQALSRMPLYLNYLKRNLNDGEYISATAIANALGLNNVQVRKDLACVSNKGKPKIGYNKKELVCDMEKFLGCDSLTNAVLIGAGKLGEALMSYDGFKDYGLNILAAFDINPNKQGKETAGIKIYPPDCMKQICSKNNVEIAIITTPQEAAQSACDLVRECGIPAVWNFAPVHLKTDGKIFVFRENMASSLAVLSQHLSKQLVK